MEHNTEHIVRESAVALIRRWHRNQPAWLFRADHRSEEFLLIEAPRLEKEPFREALDREIAWVLDLHRGRDYIISSVPRLHFIRCDDATGTTDVVEFYIVELYGSRVRTQLQGDHRNSWWTTAELLAKNPSIAGALNVRQRKLLLEADVLSKAGSFDW